MQDVNTRIVIIFAYGFENIVLNSDSEHRVSCSSEEKHEENFWQ